jgi:light-regulated signal transduction histidine kinase (bacteriophytochrome)
MIFKGYSAGAVDYLLKPVVAEVLRAKVEVFVELALARQKLQEEIAERVRHAAEISKLNAILEQKNAELISANADLETFGYTVSHDLRSPLRHIQGFIKILEKSIREKLNESELKKMETIQQAALRMGQLIDDLLSFSRISRVGMRKDKVIMDQVVQEVVSLLGPDLANRNVQWAIQPLPEVQGDHGLLRQVLMNLMANSVKFTQPRDPAKIEVGSDTANGEITFFVRDNGVGFDMNYVDKLFGVFHRLHKETEFEGTGIGLANVRRIIQRHGGRTWAEGKLGEGAAFYFTLPVVT